MALALPRAAGRAARPARGRARRRWRCRAGPRGEGLLAVLVDVEVTEGDEDVFLGASLDNATNSVTESGVSRFDVLKNVEGAGNFVLVEVYRTPEAPAAHKETEHYLQWRDAVAAMMARPREASKYRTIFPAEESAWDTLKSLEDSTRDDLADMLAVHVSVKVTEGSEDAFVEATLKNARNSVQESGVSRFDVLQDTEDACNFLLLEVYNDEGAPAKHKETAHYLEWRDAVADMMARPRAAKKYRSAFPPTAAGWDTIMA